MRLKVAVTDLAESMVMVHGPLTVQAPLQPVKTESAAGVAVRVTEVPLMKLAEQTEPQSMPEGEEVTVPLPVPVLLRVRSKVSWVV